MGVPRESSRCSKTSWRRFRMSWRCVPLLALYAVACGGCYKQPQVIRIRTWGPCLTEPPPQIRGNLNLAGPEEGCPEAFEVCLTMETALAFERHYLATKRWMNEAWLHCSPTIPPQSQPTAVEK